jgi:site-specific DNA-methyltransferase (adenine-specific)
VLKKNGSLFLHLDYREVHYIKIELDKIFGRECFMNEIIWAYDYGGRSKRKWSSKHDTILWYVKDPKNYTFNFDQIDRIPYMAPGLVGKEKAARGKTPTDCWWNTIVPTQGEERTGYPTQKPLGIINRIVHVHSNPGDTLLDFFAGSGSLGASAYQHNRNCILIDMNPQAIEIMTKRLLHTSKLSEPRTNPYQPTRITRSTRVPVQSVKNRGEIKNPYSLGADAPLKTRRKNDHD